MINLRLYKKCAVDHSIERTSVQYVLLIMLGAHHFICVEVESEYKMSAENEIELVTR